jgi:glycosyltransferase involved in cell wall biosynthesis
MISIVTPSFRQLDWLRLALSSVADQEGVEVEHIVQDAGSEGVRELFEQVTHPRGREHYRAELFIEKDAGMYDAVNRGLKRAHGEICGYLNCDEQYLPGALAQVVKFFSDHPAVDVLFGDMILVDKEAYPISYRRMVLPSVNHVRLAHLNTATCATFFRRQLLERGFYFPTEWKAIGDVVWVEKLLRARIKMGTLRQPLAAFAFTGENLGGTSASAEELKTWQGPYAFKGARTTLAVIGHRLRKAAAGAYRRRRVDVSLYTLDSPHERRRRFAENLGFGWRAPTPRESDYRVA